METEDLCVDTHRGIVETVRSRSPRRQPFPLTSNRPVNSLERLVSLRYSATLLLTAALMLGACQTVDPPAKADTASSSPPLPLADRVVVIDPGHNGGNIDAPDEINAPVDVGNGEKACDTTGTNTDDGYFEHEFNFDVATRLAALLQAEGATVMLTRRNDTGVGPCITERTAVANDADADVSVSLHADGGPPDGSGFHIMQPVELDGYNDTVVDTSHNLAVELAEAMTEVIAPADYIGNDGLNPRADMGGLNLTTVPKVMIECGNMRNDHDAALMKDAGFRQDLAEAVAVGIARFLDD